MMTPAEAQVLNKVLAREGGYVNHPDDRGGATNFGITAATLGAARGLGRSATDHEVKMMTRAEAVEILYEQYLARPRLNLVTHPKAMAALVDTAVLFGPRRAIEWAHEVTNSTPAPNAGYLLEGIAAKANAMDPDLFVAGVALRRWARHLMVVHKNPTQKVFLRGWLKRTMELMD